MLVAALQLTRLCCPFDHSCPSVSFEPCLAQLLWFLQERLAAQEAQRSRAPTPEAVAQKDTEIRWVLDTETGCSLLGRDVLCNWLRVYGLVGATRRRERCTMQARTVATVTVFLSLFAVAAVQGAGGGAGASAGGGTAEGCADCSGPAGERQPLLNCTALLAQLRQRANAADDLALERLGLAAEQETEPLFSCAPACVRPQERDAALAAAQRVEAEAAEWRGERERVTQRIREAAQQEAAAAAEQVGGQAL